MKVLSFFFSTSKDPKFPHPFVYILFCTLNLSCNYYGIYNNQTTKPFSTSVKVI